MHIVSTSAASDGSFVAIAEIGAVLKDEQHRLIGGLAIVLHQYRLGTDHPIRATADADFGVVPYALKDDSLIDAIALCGYRRVRGNRWVRTIDTTREATMDLLVPSYQTRLRTSVQHGSTNTTEVGGRASRSKPSVVGRSGGPLRGVAPQRASQCPLSIASSRIGSNVSKNGAFGTVDDIDAKEPMTPQPEAHDPFEGFLLAGDGDTETLKDADSDIGRRIAEAREAAGMERLTFGERVGVRPETVAAWESGHRRPRSNRLATIAGVLGVGISWLMIGHGDSPSEQDDLAGVAPEIASIRAELEQLVGRLDRLASALPKAS